MTDDDTRGIDFLGRPLPPSFRGRVVVIDPGASRSFDEAEWRDSIVLVRRGEVELECAGGARGTFRRGDLLWFGDLRLCALHQRGPDPTVLVAITRRRSDEGP